MSGAVATPGRAVRRTVCSAHGVDFGQVYDPGIAGQREALWLPVHCPQCENELRERLEADAELARLEADLVEETNRRAEADGGRDERIDAAVNADMAEQAMQLVAEFYARRRAEFEEFHAGQDWQRMYEQVKADRRAKILGR